MFTSDPSAIRCLASRGFHRHKPEYHQGIVSYHQCQTEPCHHHTPPYRIPIIFTTTGLPFLSSNLWSISSWKPTMSHAAEPLRHSCDLLAVCNISDPLLHRTCIGVNKNGALCKNVVSEVSPESASHWLEILSMCPTDEFLNSRLPTVAGLLLCKQWHQDQAAQICQKWHNRLNHPEAREAIRTSEYSFSSYAPSGWPRQESRVYDLIDSMDGRTDSDVASALPPVLQGYSPLMSRLSSVRRCSQAVTLTMVWEN
jgi:hypothetical protein